MKIKQAIKDRWKIFIIFILENNQHIHKGTKLEFSAIEFREEIKASEKARAIIHVSNIISEKEIKNFRDFYMVKGNKYTSYLLASEVSRAINTIRKLEDYDFDLYIDDFNVWLWGDNYPVIFVERKEDVIRYGFLIAPLEDEGDIEAIVKEVKN